MSPEHYPPSLLRPLPHLPILRKDPIVDRYEFSDGLVFGDFGGQEEIQDIHGSAHGNVE